ncbi:MAG: hypothetical protein RQ885_07330 [Desulfurococcales archaeon]|nr:hypothetical protein [Desulfurococcales archaeon]
MHYLDESEFNRIVQGFDRLRTVGIVRDDGSIDYPNTTSNLTSI